jgi:hypothetical protein
VCWFEQRFDASLRKPLLGIVPAPAEVGDEGPPGRPAEQVPEDVGGPVQVRRLDRAQVLQSPGKGAESVAVMAHGDPEHLGRGGIGLCTVEQDGDGLGATLVDPAGSGGGQPDDLRGVRGPGDGGQGFGYVGVAGAAFGDRRQELGFAADAGVDGVRRDPCRLGDLGHGGARVSLAGEQRQGRFDNRLPGGRGGLLPPGRVIAGSVHTVTLPVDH